MISGAGELASEEHRAPPVDYVINKWMIGMEAGRFRLEHGHRGKAHDHSYKKDIMETRTKHTRLVQNGIS